MIKIKLGIMNSLKGYWQIIIILCVFFLLTSSGCVTQPPPKNVTSTLSDIFSAPIGGFVNPEKYTIQDSNTTFESDYVFYSRDWSGEVKYSVFGKYKGQILNKASEVYVEPSIMTVKPDHVYIAKVYLNTSTLHEDFFIPQPSWDTSFTYSPYILHFNVSLDGTDSLFCNDELYLESYYELWRPFMNRLDVENGSLSLKKGETKNFTITYSPDLYSGPTEILYYYSDTPLNVTITPLRFIATHQFRFPVVVTITADSRLDSGNYPVKITLHGDVKNVGIDCIKCRVYPQEKTFSINASVE